MVQETPAWSVHGPTHGLPQSQVRTGSTRDLKKWRRIDKPVPCPIGALPTLSGLNLGAVTLVSGPSTRGGVPREKIPHQDRSPNLLNQWGQWGGMSRSPPSPEQGPGDRDTDGGGNRRGKPGAREEQRGPLGLTCKDVFVNMEARGPTGYIHGTVGH